MRSLSVAIYELGDPNDITMRGFIIDSETGAIEEIVE